MSQAERRPRQQAAAAQQAAEYLRQRQALAPKRIAVLVASCFPFLPWREPASPLWLLIELGAVSNPRRSFPVVPR